MPVTNHCITNAGLALEAVNRYLEGFHLSVGKHPELGEEWSLVMDKLAEAIKILSRHSNGQTLLDAWYKKCRHKPTGDIHLFIHELWKNLRKDAEAVRVIADEFFSHSVWKFTLGATLYGSLISGFILIAPFISNPVALAAVMLVSCVMLPLMTHFFLIMPGLHDLHASQSLNKVLEKTLPKNEAGESISRHAFFKEKQFDALRHDILDNCNMVPGLAG